MAETQLHEIRDTAVRLERALSKLGGEGDGLGQKARSLTDTLPEYVQDDLRQVGYLRNTVMHDAVDLSDSEFTRFRAAAARAENWLDQAVSGTRPTGAPYQRTHWRYAWPFSAWRGVGIVHSLFWMGAGVYVFVKHPLEDPGLNLLAGMALVLANLWVIVGLKNRRGNPAVVAALMVAFSVLLVSTYRIPGFW